MLRLTVLLIVFAAVALAFAAGVTLLRALARPLPSSTEATMPAPVRTTAYLVLLLLLLGTTSGCLGPA